jgi:hypothetical protein
MSVYSDEIDLEVLKYAIEHYSMQLPNEMRLTLLEALQNLQQQQPDAAKQLCELVIQTDDLDRIYRQALSALRRSYNAQERAKSAMLIAGHKGMLNGLGQILDEVTATLKQVQRQVTTTQATQAQLKILEALETHTLTLEDLTYTTGLPLHKIQTVVTNLRKQGYIDLLSAPLLHWIFPMLKPMPDRQQPIPEDEFLSLTASGYLRLHPLIQVAKRGA